MFSKLTRWITSGTGHPIAFIVCFLGIIFWLVAGPYYKFSDTWQLVMNTITSIITFLMVFLLQNSQNREQAAVQIKLDELIRAIETAHTSLIDVEKLSDKEIKHIYHRYEELKSKVKEEVAEGKEDTGHPDV